MKKLCYILFTFAIFTASKCNKVNCEIKEDCLSDIGTVKKIELKNGQIKEVTKGFFAIVTDDGRSRYAPCNMDSKWHKEGMKIKFCGIVKEIAPNVRLSATPFVLGHIEEIKK